jgi:hypothetical protein
MQINRAAPKFLFITAAALTLMLASCGEPAPRAGDSRPTAPPVTRALPLPPPAAPRRVAHPAAPVVPAPATGSDWHDAPLPAGEWTWSARASGSEARYGPPGQPPIAIMLCDRAAGIMRVALPVDAVVAGATGMRPATIAASTGSGTFVAQPLAIGALEVSAIALPVSNPMLDAMAFSRGRFRIAIDGFPPVVLPSWSEVGRVIEDCRAPF